MSATELSVEATRYGVELLKRFANTRSPPYELPADSILHGAVAAIMRDAARKTVAAAAHMQADPNRGKQGGDAIEIDGYPRPYWARLRGEVRAALQSAYPFVPLAEHERRVSELLAANSALVQRERDARAEADHDSAEFFGYTMTRAVRAAVDYGTADAWEWLRAWWNADVEALTPAPWDAPAPVVAAPAVEPDPLKAGDFVYASGHKPGTIATIGTIDSRGEIVPTARLDDGRYFRLDALKLAPF